MIVPRIIPKRRVLVIAITLIFCSAIFMTSSAIFDSITSLNSDLYGSGEDIVIIFDTEAQTPFTSSVPQSLNNALKLQDGVIETSGEKLVPVIVKNEPVFVRGVTFEDLSSIYPTIILQGSSFNDTDHGFIVAGDKLAQRLSLAIGDYVRIGSTLRNQEMRAIIGGIFHSDQEELNDELLTSISFAGGLTSRQDDLTHIILKIDPSVTNSEEIFDFVTSVYKVTIRAFRVNGTRQLTNWKLTVYDSQNLKIHSKSETGTVDILLPFGKYSFMAGDGPKNSFAIEVDITENTTLDIQVDLLVYNIDIYAHINGTPADDHFYEVLNHKREITTSGYSDDVGKINFIAETGTYSVRFWEESTKKDFDIKVLSPMNVSFDLSTIIVPYATFNGFSNGSVLIDNEGHLSLTEILSQSIIKIDNIEIQSLMNRIYYNLTDGNHNLTVERPNNVNSVFFFTVDSTYYDVYNPIDITNYSEITPGSSLNFSLTGINYDRVSKIIVNNLEYYDSVQSNELLQFELEDSYVGPINITLEGYSVGNQKTSKQYIFYITENPDPAGIVGERDDVYLLENDIITLWYSYKNITVSVAGQDLEVINNQIQIPNLSNGNHSLNLTNEIGETYLKEFTMVSNYSHLVTIVNGSTINTLDTNVSFNEDNIEIYFDPSLFSIRATSSQYSIQIFPNNSFPTMLNNEAIQLFEITSIITNITESVIFVNSAPILDPFLPVIDLQHQDVLVNGKILSLSPINESLEWSFKFLNSTIEYPTTPEAIFLNSTKQFILPPGFWEITVLNSQNNIIWESYVPIWKKILEFNTSTEIQVVGYNMSTQNMKLHLLDGYTYLINGQHYYHETFSYETIKYSRHFNKNNITIELPNWIVYAEYTINIEDILSSHQYYGTTILEMPSDFYTTKNLTIEFEIIDYNGLSFSYNQTYVYNVPFISTTLNIIDKINLSSKYDLIISNKNSAQTMTFHLKDNNLGLILMAGYWDIEIIMLDIHFKFNVSIDSITNLNLSLYNVSVYSNDINLGQVIPYRGNLLVENLNTGDSFYYRYDITSKIMVTNSIYKFTIFSDITSGSSIVEISNNHSEITVNYSIVNETGLIKLIGGQSIDSETATIRHISSNIIKSLIEINDQWLVEDLPIGHVLVTISQGGVIIKLLGWYEPSYRDMILYTEDTTLTVDNWLKNGAVVQANDVDNIGAVSGPLAYTKVIIAAEKLIIFLSLIVNISGVYSGLISESRNEIKIARSIGFSKLQVMIGILRDLWYIGFLSTIIGGLIGITITSMLFNSDTTILFGHRFVPEFSITLWIVNFISVYTIAIIGGMIGLKLEADLN